MTHISAVRRAAARTNIEIKLNVLRTWATHGIPTDPLTGRDEFFPSTLRQFKAWDGSQNSDQLCVRIPQIRSMGTDTLDANRDLKNIALSLMAMLSARAGRVGRASLAASPKNDRVSELKKLLSLRNSEVVQQQREIHRLNRHISLLERRLARQ